MTNEAAIGYMILACKALKLDNDLIQKIDREMYLQMDEKTEEEAEKMYRTNYFYDW